MIELFVEAGPQSGQRFALAGSAVLGRGQFADLVIADLAVSRRHAQIEPDGSAWTLRDLDSANGTRHNGKSLRAPVRLGDGDSVEIGQTRLRIRVLANGVAALDPDAPLPRPSCEPPESTILEPTAAMPPPLQPQPDAAFVPGQERRRQVVVRLQFFHRLAELLGVAGHSEQSLRDGLTALADALPKCRRFVLLVRDAPLRPWRVLAQRHSASDALPLAAMQAMADAAMTAQRVVMSAADAGPAPAALLRLPEAPVATAAVILRHAGALMGVLYVDGDDAEALCAADAEFLASAAAQFAALLAVQRRSGHGGLLAVEDVELTRRIQRRYLPSAMPRIDGYELAECYSAARVVGGDLFDFLTLADGRPLIVLGDVAGKGVPAALMMARIGAQLRAVAPRQRSPSDVLRALDAQIHPELERGQYLTLIAAALDGARGSIELAGAGHPLPLLRRADERVEVLPVASSSALGAGAGQFHESRVDLGRGDGLLFYTDGLDEARDPAGEPFGLARVKPLLAQARSAGQAIQSLSAAVEAHIADAEPHDDLALVALWRR